MTFLAVLLPARKGTVWKGSHRESDGTCDLHCTVGHYVLAEYFSYQEKEYQNY